MYDEKESYEITLDEYRENSKIEWLEGDENFPSIIMEWGSERFYNW